MFPEQTTGHKISIHALREEGDLASMVLQDFHLISIHALREEGDSQKTEERGQHIYFYPRPPRGGRRLKALTLIIILVRFLSTPSARRATFPVMVRSTRRLNFYPRPPRGGRP